MIEASVRRPQAEDYSPARLKAREVGHEADSQLIADGTYLVAEVVESEAITGIVDCGAWSTRKTL